MESEERRGPAQAPPPTPGAPLPASAATSTTPGTDTTTATEQEPPETADGFFDAATAPEPGPKPAPPGTPPPPPRDSHAPTADPGSALEGGADWGLDGALEEGGEVLEGPQLVVEGPHTVCVDGQQQEVPAQIRFRDGETILLSNVVGIRFDILAEPHRAAVEGHLMIVRRARSFGWASWVLWNKCIFLTVMLFLGVCQLAGAVSATLLFAGAVCFRHELSAYARDELKLSFRQQLERLAVAGYASFLLVATLWFAAWFGLRAQLATGLASAALLALDHRTGVLQATFGLSGDWKIPEINYPVMVSFGEEELPDMLRARGELRALCWDKICHVVVGSYWSEAVCSVVFYREIYNSRRARFVGYVFFNFILPTIFAAQVFGIVFPIARKYYLRFQRHVRSDWGVRVGSVFTNQLRFELPVGLRRVLAALQSPLVKLAAWFSVISSWLVPFDEGFVYIRHKLQHLRLMLDPLVWVIGRLLDVVRAVGSSFGPPLTMTIQFAFKWGSRLASLNRTAGRMQHNTTLRKLNRKVTEIVSPTRVRTLSEAEALGDGSVGGAAAGGQGGGDGSTVSLLRASTASLLAGTAWALPSTKASASTARRDDGAEIGTPAESGAAAVVAEAGCAAVDGGCRLRERALNATAADQQAGPDLPPRLGQRHAQLAQQPLSAEHPKSD